jgi:hypothetical protein
MFPACGANRISGDADHEDGVLSHGDALGWQRRAD